ncbi:cellulose binding domain-containing protein [Streptomyces sp. NPDC091383]|uniref:GH12 family glycosyl hydrolase domain-containing protein n=1 Tax=Streptomyces sp. NPDC091383 TaxID=3365996 RepID=UPI00381F41EF
MLSSWRRLRTAAWAGTMAALLLGALMVVIQPASASTATDCTPYGTTSLQGGEYTYQQNEWNSSDPQCVSIDNGSGAWAVTQANFDTATNGAPATYPSVYKGCHWGACTTGSGLPVQVSQLGSATSSWSTTQPASGAYDVAYDLWFNSTPTTGGQPDGTEVMIWLNHRGGVQPFGSRTATANVAGHGWDVWTGQQTSWKIISYVLQGGGTSFGNLDVKALIDDAVARGSINSAHYLIDAEAGFEIWQGGQGLASNSFSFNATKSSGGGGGGGGNPGTGAVKVQYKNNDSSPTDNQIKPGLRVVNTGNSAVDLSKVTIRYYFTGDGGASGFSTSCDYAAVGCSNVTQKVVALSSPKSGADHYVEIGFTSGAGTLAAGANTGDIQSRINKSDWSNFSESDDYSYATNTAYADASKVTVYVGGTLASGIEP